MRASLLHKTLAHDEGVWTISWVPNSSQLLSGSVDESVKLWEVATDGVKPLHTYTGHTLGVISVVAEASGPYAAASALDSVIRVWNTSDNTTKSVLETPPSETWRIAFGPVSDEAVVLAAAGGSTGHVTVYKAGDEDEGPQATFDLPQVRVQLDGAACLHACGATTLVLISSAGCALLLPVHLHRSCGSAVECACSGTLYAKCSECKRHALCSRSMHTPHLNNITCMQPEPRYMYIECQSVAHPHHTPARLSGGIPDPSAVF